MRSSDISLSVFIILVFVALLMVNVLSVGMKKIEDNWPVYRCNPSIMPFAGMFGHDVSSNFSYCIQNMQSSMMGVHLQPLHYLTSVLGNTANEISDSVNNIRKFINQLRDMITSIMKSIFGVFMNILITFLEIIIKIKDMVGKVIGTLATMMYILEGSVMTAESVWKGPPGGFLRMIGNL
jgi:hypothetical protein